MSQTVTWHQCNVERYMVKDFLNTKGFMPGDFVIMSTSDPLETRVIIVYATIKETKNE